MHNHWDKLLRLEWLSMDIEILLQLSTRHWQPSTNALDYALSSWYNNALQRKWSVNTCKFSGSIEFNALLNSKVHETLQQCPTRRQSKQSVHKVCDGHAQSNGVHVWLLIKQSHHHVCDPLTVLRWWQNWVSKWCETAPPSHQEFPISMLLTCCGSAWCSYLQSSVPNPFALNARVNWARHV